MFLHIFAETLGMIILIMVIGYLAFKLLHKSTNK